MNQNKKTSLLSSAGAVKRNSSSLNLLTISLIIVIGFLTNGCNNNMLTAGFSARGDQLDSGSTENSSRLPLPTATPTSLPSLIKDVAICNGKEMKYLKAQLMVYYDNFSNPRPESLRIWIPRIASDFDTSNFQVRFYRWKANEKNEVYFDPTPLTVRIEEKVGLSQVSSTNLAAINWGILKNEFTSRSKTISSLSDTFNKYSFVINLKDTSGDYEVLKIAVYDANNNKVEEADVLIPAFYAHPITYEQTKPPVLTQLHPLKDLRSTSWSGEHFAGLLNDPNCFY